jgi:hypothetical protein
MFEAERAVAVPARGERRLLIHPTAVERHRRQPEAALLFDLEAGDGEVVPRRGDVGTRRFRALLQLRLPGQRRQRTLGRRDFDVAVDVEVLAQRADRRLPSLLRDRHLPLRRLDRRLRAEHVDLRHLARLVERLRLFAARRRELDVLLLHVDARVGVDHGLVVRGDAQQHRVLRSALGLSRVLDAELRL